jgi:hypothetical protein
MEMTMGELTREKLLTMKREELLAHPFSAYVKFMTGVYEQVSDELTTHLNAELESIIAPHVLAFETAWENIRAVDIQHLNVPNLVNALTKEHGLVITQVWNRLTLGGISQCEKVKWMHKQLACVTIQVFYPDQKIAQ